MGLIGIKFLFCKYCIDPDNNQCVPNEVRKFETSASNTIDPFIFTTVEDSRQGTSQIRTKIKCMDFSSDDGNLLIGGTTNSMSTGSSSSTDYPFLGMKSRTNTMEGNDWAWLKYI
mmetsp:Transcript_11863/g.18303  ORF Transcript_11863/g.18303 Transcript_11863/m.18303 type:complete len:115 (+) Transcript_11863:353-697(+)|eukprot:CAMPEP_0170502866 /NCGR_PEP_ID=MMETSP0208-20121228/42827_1 /TAXON_ID=197538 /ORGANISM="Strombidium inclinatum, Strain S3" /LENGTH=114 /DNA_ID=CAMNT_0010782191 /DNA_START=340 /DNA_END=684 /DNA_ORIENTATION=+